MARDKQVAALPWRRRDAGIEVLLVTTRTTRRLVIPKGWPMNGKADHEAAAIEAFEEAGVRGRVSRRLLGLYGYLKTSDRGRQRHVTVSVYALHVDTELEDWPERLQRERQWVNSREAPALCGEPELVHVLQHFADHPPTDDMLAEEAKPSFWQRFMQLFR